ncbi:hypothetical protein L204_101681 [Cryptococcus depauperatus]
MAPPLVTIYVTSLTSSPTVRKHHDLLRRSLKAMEIKHEEYDLVMDEEAKRRWQRAKPPGKMIGLPGYLVGGEFIGTMDDFEEAVETQTLTQFLKQDIEIPDEPLAIPESSDLSSKATPKQKSIQDVELEKLMGSMTEEDLDKLMTDLGVNDNVGKVGFMDKSGEVADATPSDGNGHKAVPPPSFAEQIVHDQICENESRNAESSIPRVKEDEKDALEKLKKEKNIEGAAKKAEKTKLD